MNIEPLLFYDKKMTENKSSNFNHKKKKQHKKITGILIYNKNMIQIFRNIKNKIYVFYSQKQKKKMNEEKLVIHIACTDFLS